MRTLLDSVQPPEWWRLIHLTMRNRNGQSQQTGIIILRDLGRHDWIFQFPRITCQVDDQLEVAIDWMRCDARVAKRMFRGLIRDYPEHIDAYHHLALTWYRQGKLAK